jgi:3-phenylpropionate/cinnamic acid dioxygenase small subunit
MAIDEEAVRRLLLAAEVTEFLYREADLLDERRYSEWLGLLADDYQYSVPLRMNVRHEDVAEREQTREGQEICWFDEGKATVEQRVAQLATGQHWAEEPVSRVTHLVTNVRLESIALPGTGLMAKPTVISDAPPAISPGGETPRRPLEVEVSCRFVVYRNRVADESDFLVGRRADRLRRTGGGWQVSRRRLLLDQSVLLAKNLSVFV